MTGTTAGDITDLNAAKKRIEEAARGVRARSDMPPAIDISWLGGNCPVQAEGRINGKEFYFRARYDSWSLRIGGSDVVMNPEWSYEEDYAGGPFAAGWMTETEARGFIAQAARKYAMGA